MSQPYQNDTDEELLRRLIHRVARSAGAFRSTTQALLNGADEDPVLRRELLQEMDFELGELQRLIDNVTQFKALENGSFALRRRDVRTAPWLRQLFGRWQRTLPDKAIGWIIDIPEPLPVLRIDVDRLEQALNNVLGNAVKYSRVGARITARAWSSSGNLQVRISSSGPRLGADEYDHLFELFFTGESQGRFPTGLGLGLYMTRQLLEHHGGRLEVTRPTPDDDSMGFEISVPLGVGQDRREMEVQPDGRTHRQERSGGR